MRRTWAKMPPPPRWNTSLRWIKSGEESVVTGTPYEVWEKRYGPDLLPDNPAVIEMFTQDIASDITKSIIEASRFSKGHARHYIQGKCTAVVGPDLDTRAKARRAASGGGRQATLHTRRSPIPRFGQFVNDIRQNLTRLSQLPSRPSWLLVVSVTLYYAAEGDVDLIIRKGQQTEAK